MENRVYHAKLMNTLLILKETYASYAFFPAKLVNEIMDKNVYPVYLMNIILGWIQVTKVIVVNHALFLVLHVKKKMVLLALPIVLIFLLYINIKIFKFLVFYLLDKFYRRKKKYLLILLSLLVTKKKHL